VGLEDVVVEVLRLLGTQVDGRRLTVEARGHRVELDVARVRMRPPSMRPPSMRSPSGAGAVVPRSSRPSPPSPPSSWQDWADSVGEWVDWTRWTELAPWGAPPQAREPGWPALGRLALALRNVAVDGRTPFEVLDVTAAEVVVELARPAALVARDLSLVVEASGAALRAWLPPELRVRLRADGRLGVTRRGWGPLGEATAALRVVDGLLQADVDAVEVRGIRLRAPRRLQRRLRLDPASYHPGLRFEEIGLVDDVAGASRRLRARLHLDEWREPVSFEQLGDLRSRLARRAPLTLRSLLGG
jgi:hypothetical protein